MKPHTPDDDEGARYSTKDVVTKKTGHLLNFPKVAADGRNEKVADCAQDPVDHIAAELEE